MNRPRKGAHVRIGNVEGNESPTVARERLPTPFLFQGAHRARDYPFEGDSRDSRRGDRAGDPRPRLSQTQKSVHVHTFTDKELPLGRFFAIVNMCRSWWQHLIKRTLDLVESPFVLIMVEPQGIEPWPLRCRPWRRDPPGPSISARSCHIKTKLRKDNKNIK